jgi:sterol desaturase/sphingolipid hydroxylase (fatty acid hydroxylase superfamily)
MEALSNLFAIILNRVFEGAVLPGVYALGMMTYAEMAFDATEFFLIGVIEVSLMAVIFGAMERWRPVEQWAEHKATRVDVLYTLLNRLGLVPLLIFFLLTPPVDAFDGWLRLHDIIFPKIEDFIPGLIQHPLAGFALYVVVLDFVGYWLHRWQHRLEPWWALHSLHHSQRQMSFWTDNRNHLLDDFLIDACFAMVALVIGVAPGQFIFIVVATRVVQSYAHANVRVSFGAGGERILVSPRFHRLHHAIGAGHEGSHRGCNFAVLFPIWDIIFGSANFNAEYHPTGIRDQLEGRDYGEGFWRQQRLGINRLTAALTTRDSQHKTPS